MPIGCSLPEKVRLNVAPLPGNGRESKHRGKDRCQPTRPRGYGGGCFSGNGCLIMPSPEKAIMEHCKRTQT
jgi:hypothetical protein